MENKDKYEIEQIVDAYFDGIVHKATICMDGRNANIDIWYEDFKTATSVIEDLRKVIPNLNNIEVCRDYSDVVSAETICKIVEELPNLYVKDCKTGEFKMISISDLINETLLDKDLEIS